MQNWNHAVDQSSLIKTADTNLLLKPFLFLRFWTKHRANGVSLSLHSDSMKDHEHLKILDRLLFLLYV